MLLVWIVWNALAGLCLSICTSLPLTLLSLLYPLMFCSTLLYIFSVYYDLRRRE